MDIQDGQDRGDGGAVLPGRVSQGLITDLKRKISHAKPRKREEEFCDQPSTSVRSETGLPADMSAE
jgi:hypothetical protein